MNSLKYNSTFSQVLGLGTTYDGETVLVTTDTSVMVGDMEDEDMIETEYVVQGGFSPCKSSYVVQYLD